VDSSRSELHAHTARLFEEKFDASPTLVASAPGRVNLIGEHTDYNEGFVLPAAIDRATAVALRPMEGEKLIIHAHNLNSTIMLSLGDLSPRKSGAWSNYIAGVASLLRERGVPLRGATMLVNSTVPRASGLSSSAALEVAAASALSALAGVEIPGVDMAALCQRAEHEFAGVQCGIMDQFISRLGRRDHALKIDCRSLEYEHVPFPPGVRLIVCNTNIRRGLASSEYNQRRAECSAAVAALAGTLRAVRSLRDVTPEQFHERESGLDPLVRKRARHVILENARVTDAVAALRRNDLSALGRLMLESHASLRDDYAVSCAELDAVVEICMETGAAIGARMTGAGFGGCAICLAPDAAAAGIIDRLKSDYPRRTGKQPGILVCTPDEGATVQNV